MSTQSLEITVGAANLLTSNQPLHWAVRSRAVRNLRNTAWLGARSQKLTPMTRARLVVHVSWPDRRRRDVHNIMPTIKALVDGLVDAHVLPDDSDAHLVGPDLRVAGDLSGIPRVTRLRLDLEEIP